MRGPEFNFIEKADKNNHSVEGDLEIEKLKSLMTEISERLKKEGVPVNDHCRIDEDRYRGIYSSPKVDKDLWEINKINKKFYPNIQPEKLEEYKLKKKSEQLEILKTVIFNKLMGEKSIIVRSSLHDDLTRGVDNIFLDRQTGEVICAFDEVGDTSGSAYELKKKEVLDKNEKEGGAYLDYGIGLVNGKIVLGRKDYLPVFYLAFPENLLGKGISKLGRSLNEISENDIKLFQYFINALKSQAENMNLKGKSVDLAGRVKIFVKMLDKVVEKYKI
jgi:hypothetical protein